MNIAEIELSVFSRQCLNRRISDLETLRSEAEVWQQHRNENAGRVDWQFRTRDARIKLNIERLLDLEESLKDQKYIMDGNKHGKERCYEIGTVARVRSESKDIYLVAIDTLNRYGVPESSLENVIESLEKLWYYIGNQGGFTPLVIPILGTGHSRIPITREEMIIEIVTSFTIACSKRKFCEKLTIVISEEDYREHSLGLQNLAIILRLYANKN